MQKFISQSNKYYIDFIYKSSGIRIIKKSYKKYSDLDTFPSS